MSIFISVLALAFLYILAIYLSKYGAKFYWIFELEHFLAGFFIAMFLSNFLFNNINIIALVVSIGILWEIWELIVNKNRNIQRFLIDKFNYYIDRESTANSMRDLLLDFFGVVTFLYLFN